MKKKLLFVLFATLFALMLAVSVSAATTVTPSAGELGDCVINGETVSEAVTQGMSYTVLDEEAKTVALSSRGETDSFTGAVVIPSTIEIDGVDYTVVKTNAEVFKGTSITKIYVPDTVTEIFGSASGSDTGTFANCSYLSEVYIGTGIKIIGRFAFTSIGKSSPVTVFNVAGQVQELGEYAFNAANFADDCEITFDSSDMRIIGPRVFDNGSKSLKRIDSAKLESIGERGFASCKSLEYILIPEYCTVGLYAFNGVDTLQTAIIRSASDEIKEIPKEMFSSGSSGYKTNIYIKGKVEATEWAVLPGRAFNIYMDSYENAKYFADSIMLYQHNRISNGTWYFCTPYNGNYCFSANGSFGLTAKTDVTVAPHTAIYHKGVETAATCNQYAGIGDICEVCGTYFNVTQTGSEYDESAHNYVFKSHIDPQCTETGLDVYECVYCAKAYDEVIPALGHDYASETILPTCSLEGYTNNVCTRCDYSMITNRIDTIPHSYLGSDFVLDGINISYNTSCKYCGVAGDAVQETLVNKCYIEGYGIFDATLEYLSISADGVVTPSDATFDNAVIYFPSYVEIDGSIVEVKTIQNFQNKSIKGIYIPDTVTRVVGADGNGCFINAVNLKNLVVGKGVTTIEQDAFRMASTNIMLDEFIFKGTITSIATRGFERLCAADTMIGYEFNTRLTYLGKYVNGNSGTIIKEVYITNECDLTEKFAFNGSNGLKRVYIEGGATEATAKELTQEMFSGDAKGLEILISGYVKATGQAVLPTKGALLFFQTIDQAKVFAATLKAYGYPERGQNSGWYICESTETDRYLLNNYTTVASEITFKTQSGYKRYHAGLTTTTESTCTQGGTVTGSCYMCGATLESTTSEPTPHNYDGGVFTTEPTCCVLGEVKYTCLDCGAEKYVVAGYDLSAHKLDTIVTINFENGYNEKGAHVWECSICHEILEEETPSFPVLFTYLGFSAPENGDGVISISYRIDHKAIAEYEKISGKEIKHGIFVVLQDTLGENDILGEDESPASGVLKAEMPNDRYTIVGLKISGFTTDEQKKTKMAFGLYAVMAKADSKEFYYLQHGKPEGNDKYYFASYNDLVTAHQ